ncbi:hypothetical protein INR49_024344, partial [Caranx melampygus]
MLTRGNGEFDCARRPRRGAVQKFSPLPQLSPGLIIAFYYQGWVSQRLPVCHQETLNYRQMMRKRSDAKVEGELSETVTLCFVSAGCKEGCGHRVGTLGCPGDGYRGDRGPDRSWPTPLHQLCQLTIKRTLNDSDTYATFLCCGPWARGSKA